MNNLSATCCSVLINRKPCGFLSPSRGVKQGDLLTPILFILASEGFSRGLNALLRSGMLRGFASGCVQPVSHLGFADDLFVFINGSLNNLQAFKQFLKQYQRASGQLVNYHKSQYVVGGGLSSHRAVMALNMRHSKLSIKYLGSYLFKCINRSQYCTSLLTHFDARLTGWLQKLLSMAGRVALI